MIAISFKTVFILISFLWLLTRSFFWIKNKKIDLKRESKLLFVYICIVVIARFTFFPFEKIDGMLQPLFFDPKNAFPPRLNLVPFINLFDYPELKPALLNFIGNTAMFIPVGIIWPAVFRELENCRKALLAGFGYTLMIEILQLPFIDRVSDIDDLILNFVGFSVGYGIWLLFKKIRKQ